jgi:hypothetical protein
MGVGWGGGPWDNQQFGRGTFGVRFCAVGRALRSCPATKAVLCVGRFLRGCLADKYVGWLSLWSALCPPPPSAHAFSLPSSHPSVLLTRDCHMGSIANCSKETDTLDPVTYFWFLYFAQNVKYIINYFWL